MAITYKIHPTIGIARVRRSARPGHPRRQRRRPHSIYLASDSSKQLHWRRESDTDATEFPDLQRVTNWRDLGFILNASVAASPNYLEIERNQAAISRYESPPAAEAAVIDARPQKGQGAASS